MQAFAAGSHCRISWQDLVAGSRRSRCAPVRIAAMSTPVWRTNKVVTFPEMNILIHCVRGIWLFLHSSLRTGLLRTIDHRWSTLTVIFNPLIIRTGPVAA